MKKETLIKLIQKRDPKFFVLITELENNETLCFKHIAKKINMNERTLANIIKKLGNLIEIKQVPVPHSPILAKVPKLKVD